MGSFFSKNRGAKYLLCVINVKQINYGLIKEEYFTISICKND